MNELGPVIAVTSTIMAPTYRSYEFSKKPIGGRPGWCNQANQRFRTSPSSELIGRPQEEGACNE
jgi:hypothetical protein